MRCSIIHPTLRLILLLASGMALFGCDSRKPSARFLVLGDSYTSGERVGPDDRWPVQLAHALKADGIDLGQPQIIATTGWTTDELSAGIDRADPVGPFQLVTLSIGVNNQFRGRDPEEYRQQFHRLLDRAIRFAGGNPGHVVVVSIPDWGVTPFARGQDRSLIGRQIDHFNNINRAESETAGVAYVDVTPESRTATTQPALIAADGLHPSPHMYAEWVELMLPVVERALQK
jgi:lysophospholipase L1-like esterase